jgi:predicted signal transduction protein with EAL and GGDEF domain
VARHLRSSVRPDDLLARLGGDEFVVLTSAIDGEDHLAAIALDVLRGLDRPVDVGGSSFQLTACIGMALAGADEPVTATDLLRRADLALYHAKRTTDMNIALFDDALEEHTRRRTDLDEELRDAIARGELSVVYQPIVSLATGKVSEFEALARWTNRRFGVVTPDEFIAIAEDNGQINAIGDWVLEVACRQMAAWQAGAASAQTEQTRMAVNVSARQLCDVAFPERVARILAATALPADSLILEITETAVLDDLDASARVLAELRALGVRLSMDDFGTGYSSLTYLRRIPVHTLKIDRTFVDGLGDVPEDAAIVESIINLGHSLGLEVVAEGVETMWQLQHLVELGCDHGQGFLWSRAVDAAAAGALLHDTFYVAVSSHA